jgi:hypothetical protein
MRFRKLRIAWSTVCLVACVPLIMLWVRSYIWTDEFPVRAARLVISQQGRAGSLNLHIPGPITFRYDGNEVYLPNSFWGFGRTAGMVAAPYWFPVAIVATIAVLPWMRELKWRFSLRTLLIATTLVALVLGLIVWGAK